MLTMPGSLMGQKNQAAAAAPEAPSTLVSASFTAANGTAITDYTPETDVVGSGFVLESLNETGSVQIQSNSVRAFRDTTTYIPVISIDSGEADVTITLTVTTQGNNLNSGTPHIAFRRQDIDNLWWAGHIGSGAFGIVETNAGVSNTRASTPGVFAISTTYVLKVVLSGNSIVATVDDADEISHSSSFLATETSHGFILLNNALFNTADNLLIVG